MVFNKYFWLLFDRILFMIYLQNDYFRKLLIGTSLSLERYYYSVLQLKWLIQDDYEGFLDMVCERGFRIKNLHNKKYMFFDMEYDFYFLENKIIKIYNSEDIQLFRGYG